MRTRSAVARPVSTDPVPEIASSSSVFPVAEKGRTRVGSAAGGGKPSETAGTDSPTGSRAPEKKENEVRVGGALVKLKELSVLIRRLTPEEIMLHTRKSSRKRKADGPKTPRNSRQNQLNKKFRRIWVVSDNSDEDSDSTSDTTHDISNNSSISSDKQCDSKSTQDQGHCPEVKQGMKKDIRDCKLCNRGGNTISEKSRCKHRTRKSTGNQSEKRRLTESDRPSVVSENNSELQLRTKVDNFSRESVASRDSYGKGNSLVKNLVPRSPSNVDISPEIVSNKMGALSQGPTFSDSVNLPDRLLFTNGEHRKIPKNISSHNSSLLNKGVKPKKSPPQTHKEPDAGKNVVSDLKSASVPTTMKSPVVGSSIENPTSSSPKRAVENAPSFPERVASKEISRSSRDNIHKESHTLAPEKPPPSTLHEKRIKKKTCKNEDSNVVISDKLSYNASPVRQVKKSSVLGEMSPKEVPNASCSLSKQNPAPISKEKPLSESASSHDRDQKVKASVVEKSMKSKDGQRVIQQENVPVPCERLGQKKTGHSDILSKETHSFSAQEKLHADSVSESKEKCMGKKVKSKESHLVEGNMSKNCASPDLKNAEVCHGMQGSLGVQISDHASNDLLCNTKESESAPSGKELPCGSGLNSANEVFINSICQAVNGSIGELSQKLGPVEDSIRDASGVPSAQSDKASTSKELSREENIISTAGSKQSPSNPEKVRHIPRSCAVKGIENVQEAKSAVAKKSEVVTTGPHQGVKDNCRREKDICKIASTHSEKSQLASKVEKGQRRMSKNRRLSADVHIPESTFHPKVEKHSVPAIKSNEMEISKKSQPVSTPNEETEKSSKIMEGELILVKSSLIEKSGCSSNQKIRSPSAIEADNVDQLMAQYETLLKHDSAVLVDKKSDKKLNQNKIRNIFGEEHLIEDSECILKSSIMGEGKPMNSPAFNIPDLASSSSFLNVEPSVQKADFTASGVSESSKTTNKRRNNVDEVKSIAKKRKLVRSRNAEGKSRRHSLQTPSSMAGKKTMGKGRNSLDRAVSCNETRHRNASCERRPSLTTNSNVDIGTCRHVSVICRDVGKTSQEESEEALVDSGNDTPRLPQGVSGMEEEAIAAEHSSGEDSDVIFLDIPCNLKEDDNRLEDMEKKVNPFNPESSPSNVLDQIVMSPPRAVPVEDGSQADLENDVDLSSIVPQVETDSGPGLESIMEDDDLLDEVITLCDPDKIQQKLEELEEEVKRKEEEMKKAKAKKAKMFRAWEKAFNISCVRVLGVSPCTTLHEETDKVKEEHDNQDDLPETPESGTSEDCDVPDVKDEFDRNSTVSTEICESPHDPEELIQLSDSGENGSGDSSNLGNNADPSVKGSLSSPSSVMVEPAVNNLRHSLDGSVEHAVNAVAVDKSAVVEVNAEGGTQVGAQGFLRGITLTHDSADQDAQASAIGTSVSSELTDTRIGENNVNRNDCVGGMTPRREERIRVRGLSDLLAIPPSQPSTSQNNLYLATPQEPPSQDDPTVGTSTETINPAEKVVMDSFKGENYYKLFKEIQASLAELGSALMVYIHSRNTPHMSAMGNNLGLKVRAHTDKICRSIHDVVYNFQYNEEGAFASFLFFQVSFLMRHHRNSFTLDHMKYLIKIVFRHFVKCWECDSNKQAIADYFSKLAEIMGIGPLNLMPDKSDATSVGQNGNGVVRPNNSQSVTTDNNMLPNPQSSSTVPSCEPSTVPLVTSHQNLPAHTMSIRNQQLPVHLVNTSCGNFQSRLDFSSASDHRINPNPPDVNRCRTAMQAGTTRGVGNVPNVSVNPNHQLIGDPAFVPVVHQIPSTLSGVSRAVSGEISNISQPRVVCRQLSQMNMVAGQLNTNHRNSLAGQNSNMQNCMNLPRPFQPSHINPTVNGQFSNSVHMQTGTSLLENLIRNQCTTQQNTAATMCVNNNAGATQVSMSSSNRVQHRRPSLPVEMVRNQDSVQSQPCQGDPPPRYFGPRPGEVLTANPVHVPGNVGQTTPLHPSQSGYQPHPSRVNAEYHPTNPSNQGTHNHFAQRQMPRSDVLVAVNAQTNNHPSMPYFPSSSHNGSATSSRSLVVHSQGTVNSMPAASNAPLSTVTQNNRTEGVSGQSTSMGWKAIQQQGSHPSMYSNNLVAEISGSTVVNHSVVLSNSVDGAVRNVSQVTSHSVFQQGTHVQRPQPGHPADIQPLMGQAVTRLSMDVPTKHTSSVLHAAPHQMNPGTSPYHSSSSYAPQQHNAGMMGASHQGSRPNQSSFLEHPAASTVKRQTQQPSLTSPVLRSSPSGVTEDNDQSRGQGTQCRPISNDSGYRSPTQCFDFNCNANSSTRVCFFCHQEASLTCSRCQLVFYCSPTCQTRDWTRHRLDCRVQVPVSVACKT